MHLQKQKTKKQFLKRQQKIREIEIFIILQLLVVFISCYVTCIYLSNHEKEIRSTTYPQDLIQPIIKIENLPDEKAGSEVDEIEDKVLAPVSIPELIEQECIKAGLSKYEIDKFQKIAYCESKYNPYAKNPNSTASGIYQFLRTSWLAYGEGDVFDPLQNIKAAIRYYKVAGFSPWECNNLI